MEWLHSVLERARERFKADDEYPLIDDAEMLDHEVIYKCWPWEYGGPCRLTSVDELMETALTSDHTDLPVRFAYLNFFYRLAHYPADDVAVDIQDRDNAPGYREQFLGDLKTLVGLTRDQLNGCRDARQIRWEIVNACAVQDWHLAGTLYRRLEDLAERDQVAQVLAIRGRHELLTVFAHRWELDDFGLEPWAPIPERRFAALDEVIFSLKSVGTADEPALSLSPDEQSRTKDAAHHLEKAINCKLGADLAYRFLLLRCRLALGAFQDAAADCEALLRRRDELAEGPWKAWDCADFIVSRLYKLAVDSYEADGRIDRAITASDRWMREFPAQPGIHECRARLFQQQGDLDSAYESLRKEVASNPPRGEKPAISMALRFGELYGTPEVQLKRFRRNLDLNEIDLVRSLVGIHWPKARALDDPNSKDWINGCSLLLKRVPDDPSLAVFLFGRVAENHLRTRLFERFRATLGVEITSSIPSEEQDPITNYVRHGTRGHISLEQMLNEIRHPEARSAVGRRFREWLRREKNARFLQQIDLKALGDLNNRAKHKRESLLTWRDAEDMARLSREVLDVLLLM